ATPVVQLAQFSPPEQTAPEAAPELESQPAVVNQPPAQSAPREERERGGRRGRRRRGSHRDRDRESRYSRPAQSDPRTARHDYGPPAGYEPIILPGESISKYRGRAAAAPQPEAIPPSDFLGTEPESPLFEKFPEDEPLFAAEFPENMLPHEVQQSSKVWEQPSQPALSEAQEARSLLENVRSFSKAETAEYYAVGSEAWDREQKRLHEMNVAAVFGGDETVEKEQEPPRSETQSFAEPTLTAASGTVEEEEIDEEEADIASYVEELEEDAAFDEFEEETHAAGDHRSQDIAASADNGAEAVPFTAEPISPQTAELAQTEEEVEEATEEEAELEEAQAEAEALVDAEAIGNGTVDARAEVRAPAATAPYTQRARRFDRDRGRRGGFRRRGGGRRVRRTEPQNLHLSPHRLQE